MSRAYKKYSTSDNLPIQVESAIRDGSGKNIENNYAKQDGSYDTMNVGHAESSSSLDTSIGVDDQTPFNYQTAGGDSDITTGIQNLKKLVGASVVFNQLVKELNSTNWSVIMSTATFSDGVATFTATAKNGNINQYLTSYIDNHRYLAMVQVKLTTATTAIRLFGNGGHLSVYTTATTEWQTLSKIFTGVSSEDRAFNVRDTRESDWDAVQVKNAMCIDLTQMFGSQVADYIYAKEQANAGDGVAIFKSMFPNDYYAYNEGTFIHSQSAKLKMVDYNQFDKSKAVSGYISDVTGELKTSSTLCASDYIQVIPNQTLSAYGLDTSDNYGAYYDINKNYIQSANFHNGETSVVPSNAYYLRKTIGRTSYIDTACIFLYWDGSRIGYEPYQEHIYDLPNDELKGVLKVVDNKIVADGDEEYPDGTKKARYVQITINAENITDYGQAGLSNFYQALTNIIPSKKPWGNFTATNIGKSSNYLRVDNNNLNYIQDKTIALYTTSLAIRIRDDSITTLEGFKALCPITLIYRVADDEVTETTSTAFAENIYADDFGTMEFLDENNARISGIQGNEIFYKANISGFAESLYVKTDGDVDELVTQEDISDTALATRGYIKLTSITGYDATKTQVLKNIEGVFTWVDEA